MGLEAVCVSFDCWNKGLNKNKSKSSFQLFEKISTRCLMISRQVTRACIWWAAASSSDGEIEGLWREAELTGWLVPHDLVTRDLELVQHRGQDEGSDVLHHLVTHALPLAHGEGLEVFGLLESVIILDKPPRVVTLGWVPKLLTEVHVVIVDKDDSVCVNLVSYKKNL